MLPNNNNNNNLSLLLMMRSLYLQQCKQLMTLVDIKKLTEHLKTLNLKKKLVSMLSMIDGI